MTDDPQDAQSKLPIAHGRPASIMRTGQAEQNRKACPNWINNPCVVVPVGNGFCDRQARAPTRAGFLAQKMKFMRAGARNGSYFGLRSDVPEQKPR